MMTGRFIIEQVAPVVAHGNYPAKAVTAEHVPIGATVWGEQDEAVAASVEWRDPAGARRPRQRMLLADPGLDRWEAVVVPDQVGLWEFRVDAWGDPWSGWEHGLRAKLEAGQDAAALANDLANGAMLLLRMARRPGVNQKLLKRAARMLCDHDAGLEERVGPALGPEVGAEICRTPLRESITRDRWYQLWVDRPRALFGSWYEFFPRSTGGVDDAGRPVHGTFKTAAAELERIAAMKFDVVYLPPIHPIGRVNRKGPNNSLTARPGDVGSPWAVGSAEGGHDAVHPDLGTVEDFGAFVAAARDLGLEVALDLALQCAPDHPWVTRHPEWFTIQPDGTVASAQNPPKTYEDIYPLNFDKDPEGLRAEILRVVRFWIGRGVRIFRVDNPHTKPPVFWDKLIDEVLERDPDVLFLAEAFTRPALLGGLSERGFTQTYTYFTWRSDKDEIAGYLAGLVDSAHFLRPNLFVNTPDVLGADLQQGGPPMFAPRAALAALLAPSWGIAAGFELFEHEPAEPGSEEYLDSEKYQLRPRDFAQARRQDRSLEPWIARLNDLRRVHPALQQLRTLRFHQIDNDALIAFSKTDPAGTDAVLCVVTLNPSRIEQGTLRPDLAALGRPPGARCTARDEVTGDLVDLAEDGTEIRIDPQRGAAMVLSWDQA